MVRKGHSKTEDGIDVKIPDLLEVVIKCAETSLPRDSLPLHYAARRFMTEQ